MTHYTDIDRTASLTRLCPDLFTVPRTVLYVGAHDTRFDYADEFRAACCAVTVLEAYTPNADYLWDNCEWLAGVYNEDLRS